jgi:aminoglycoside phosphotransferase (APT) family kinase protein
LPARSFTTPVAEPDGGAPPAWLLSSLPRGSIGAASRLGWGFHNETWRVDLVDGLRIVVARFADAASTAAARERTAAFGPQLRAVGVLVPAVLDLGEAADPRLVATSFVDGVAGAALLDHPGGPERVGAIMGSTWRRLAGVDLDRPSVPVGWACAHGLAAADRDGRLARALGRVDPGDRGHVLAEIDRAREVLAGRVPTFVHGDFAPVNVVIRDGDLGALVDLELAGRADPWFDAAWFRWIVTYHHPAAGAIAWDAFRATAGIDHEEAAARDLLRALPVVGLLERLDSTTADAEADHWLAMLRSIARHDA